jgi:hypothetical protein
MRSLEKRGCFLNFFAQTQFVGKQLLNTSGRAGRHPDPFQPEQYFETNLKTTFRTNEFRVRLPRREHNDRGVLVRFGDGERFHLRSPFLFHRSAQMAITQSEVNLENQISSVIESACAEVDLAIQTETRNGKVLRHKIQKARDACCIGRRIIHVELYREVSKLLSLWERLVDYRILSRRKSFGVSVDYATSALHELETQLAAVRKMVQR